MALITALFGIGSSPWVMDDSQGTDPLYEGYAAELKCSVKPYYREKITKKSGKAVFDGNVGLTLDYESEFYGHDSLINRDFVRYGSRYESGLCLGMAVPTGELAVTDFNGDGFGDILQYRMGTLYIYPVTMRQNLKKTYTVEKERSFTVGFPEKTCVGTGLHLCGAEDFNADAYGDILFAAGNNIIIYYGSDDGFSAREYGLGASGYIRCGDIDGDGCAEVISVDGNTVTGWSVSSETAEKTSEAEIPGSVSDPENVFAADVNSDGLCDIVFQTNDGGSCFTSLFGRGDGRFGPYEEDGDNKNLYSVFNTDLTAKQITFGDITGNGAADIFGAFRRYGITSARVLYAYDNSAYDYSLFGMLRDGEYRVYSGCRWADANVQSGDGDHIMLTTSEDGVHWKRHIDAPMFLLGIETGEEGWWTDNTLEPEVIYADGTYHMYWQCSSVTPDGNYGDKIGYASSADGVHWDRKTDSPAIICDNPEIGFNHEEVIYVPDDPDGRPFWMYTGHFIDGVFSGYVRIRSSEPDEFLYSDAEKTDGFAQIGNQIAYFTDTDGSRVFVRITFSDIIESDGNTYARPVLYLSRDGLNFTEGRDCVLAGVDITDERTENNRNMYFLGMVTKDGTGEIPQNADGSFELMYLATDSKTPVAPEIFRAEAGYGVMRFSPAE